MGVVRWVEGVGWAWTGGGWGEACRGTGWLAVGDKTGCERVYTRRAERRRGDGHKWAGLAGEGEGEFLGASRGNTGGMRRGVCVAK